MADSAGASGRFVRIERSAQVVTVTLDRAARHNSLVPALLEQLAAAFTQLAEHDEADVAILRAAGRSFSTGGDLTALHAAGEDRARYADALVGALNRAIVAIAECRCPVVAAVDGAVTGGALGLVLAADLVIVTPAASFTPWYARVGLSPDGGWTAMLPNVIGAERTREVLLLERTIDAATARDWGLANALVERAALDETVAAWARRLLAHDRTSLAAARHLLDDDESWRAGLERERREFVATVDMPSAIAGVAAFVARKGAR